MSEVTPEPASPAIDSQSVCLLTVIMRALALSSYCGWQGWGMARVCCRKRKPVMPETMSLLMAALQMETNGSVVL